MLTFGELYAGVGGFSLGFTRAGMRCKWQVEINERRRELTRIRFPEAVQHGDVNTFPTEEIESWRVNVIAGGFPCQDISY